MVVVRVEKYNNHEASLMQVSASCVYQAIKSFLCSIDNFFAHSKTSGTTDIKLNGVVVVAAFNIASNLDNGDWECITT